MKVARACRLWLAGVVCCSTAWAQIPQEGDWQEAAVPPPPAFSVDRLVRFEVNPNSPLVYGVDPQTLQISSADRVVRYVVVASSPSGARNVFYEGIRCSTGQVKTYAHHNGQQWIAAIDPPWVPMIGRPSRHALQLARQGACDNAATPARAQDVIRSLQHGRALDMR